MLAFNLRGGDSEKGGDRGSLKGEIRPTSMEKRK